MELLKKLGKKKVLSSLDCPKKMSMDITILNPLVTVKPNESSCEYLYLDLGNIHVTNSMEKSTSRLLKANTDAISEVFSEHFFVKISRMQMCLVRADKSIIEMSNSFDMSVDIDMPSQVNELKFVY